MKLEVAATKSDLLAIKEALNLAREGHDLLSQKREVLLAELMRLAHDIKGVRQEADAAVAEAYAALRLVLAQVGLDGADRLALACRERMELTVRERSVMGVPVPLVDAEPPPLRPVWGIGDSPVTVDVMAARFRRALALLVEQAEIESAVWRMARDLAKTQRRTNALEYLIIPQHREAVKFIQETLEERDREAQFQLTRIKARRGKPS